MKSTSTGVPAAKESSEVLNLPREEDLPQPRFGIRLEFLLSREESRHDRAFCAHVRKREFSSLGSAHSMADKYLTRSLSPSRTAYARYLAIGTSNGSRSVDEESPLRALAIQPCDDITSCDRRFSRVADRIRGRALKHK